MKVAVRDTELFFDVDGAELVPDGPVLRRRPTIILLHGGPGADHSRLKPAFSFLRDVARVIYLDHRLFEDQRHNLSKDHPNEYFAAIRR